MNALAAASNGEDAALSATVAIVVAVIALLGVLIGQTITLVNERAKRRDEQTKTVRAEVQKVMMGFFDYAEFAQTTAPGSPYAQRCKPYDDEWERVSRPFAAGLAHMAGRGTHRNAALIIVEGLNLQDTGFHIGENIRNDPRTGYVEMARAGFEIVAAWLRGDRVPRRARRTVRDAARMQARIDAEYRWRDRAERKDHKSGVLRLGANRTRVWVRQQWRRWVRRPARSAWAFLFAE